MLKCTNTNNYTQSAMSVQELLSINKNMLDFVADFRATPIKAAKKIRNKNKKFQETLANVRKLLKKQESLQEQDLEGFTYPDDFDNDEGWNMVIWNEGEQRYIKCYNPFLDDSPRGDNYNFSRFLESLNIL